MSMPSDQASRSPPGIAVDADWTGLFVDGDWLPTGDRASIDVSDPSTRETWTTVPAATIDDVDAAYEAATAAQSDWADTNPKQRVQVIESVLSAIDEAHDSIVELLTTESGSVHTKAEIELSTAEAIIAEARGFPTRLSGEIKDSAIAGKENLVKREPAGIVTVIPPWNYPFHLAMRAVAPAIALGNAVVLKPASDTPVTSGLLVARLFELAGVPPGVINVVPGRGSEIGNYVAGHPDTDVVAFTGSTAVGREVAKQAVSSLARPALELGGNCPHVVLDDADVERAAAAGTFGAFGHQGQICISINRHLVHESIYDDYVDTLVENAQQLPTGSAHEPGSFVGPLINEQQRDQVLDYIDQTVQQGGTLETGGEHDGLVVEPTVISDVENDMTAACSEHFGPIAPVIPFTDDEDAIELANDTDHGLAASVFSADRNRAEDIADAIEAGMVHINDQPINDEAHVPFGGMKASGMGRYNGEAILRRLTEQKWISVQREPRNFPI